MAATAPPPTRRNLAAAIAIANGVAGAFAGLLYLSVVVSISPAPVLLPGTAGFGALAGLVAGLAAAAVAVAMRDLLPIPVVIPITTAVANVTLACASYVLLDFVRSGLPIWAAIGISLLVALATTLLALRFLGHRSDRSAQRGDRSVTRARLKFSAMEQPTIVSFEPLAEDFPIAAGGSIFVDVSAVDLPEIEVTIWPTGISVWLPYPDDHIVLDEHGDEIGRL